jgi:hypothetical protein
MTTAKRTVKNPGGTDIDVLVDTQTVDTVTADAEFTRLLGASGTKLDVTTAGEALALVANGSPAAATGNMTALNNAVSLDVTKYSVCALQISGTYVGAVTIEASIDGGATWVAVYALRADNEARESVTPVLTNTTRLWEMDCSALTNVRLRCSTYTSGTIAGRITASAGSAAPMVNATLPTAEVTGSHGVNGATTTLTLDGSYGQVLLYLAGTSTQTIQYEYTIDGTNWQGLSAAQPNAVSQSATANSFSSTGTAFQAALPVGCKGVRLRTSAYSSGTVTTIIRATQGGGGIPLMQVGAINNVATIGTSITPGVGATNLGKAEDAAHASGDTGVMVLGVRNDNTATATPTNANGDYGFVSLDATGRVYTTPPSFSITLTSAGLTIATTNYASGDQMGTEMTATSLHPISGGRLLITSALYTTDAAATPNGAFDLFLFNATTSPASDNAVYGWSDADMQKLVGVISFPAATFPPSGSANGYGIAIGGSGLQRPLSLNLATTTLAADMVARAAINFFSAVGDIKIKLSGVLL